MPTRRAVLSGSAGLGLAALLAGCAVSRPGGGSRPGGSAAALSARPGDPRDRTGAVPPGTRTLRLGAAREPLLHVPAGLAGGDPLPLVVSLHGAGGNPEAGLALFEPLAEEYGIAVLAPGSQRATWDAVGGDYGPDARGIDRALEQVFTELPVDGARVAVAGFSDGASYALGLGLANGELFSSVVAFSPGFVPAAPRSGTPDVFVSHGRGDDVLPLDRTSGRIVPALREDGYDVTYREFSGGHVVPPELAREAVERITRP
ncbi:alpha/beta hydrolase [Blastococcus sp. LR1]|uniref:alpha/beta hydrolase n=1 Tax=Blastococcus sp. LR1 TaxID=2877000 RepID=UPI001CCD886C|nr:PHB depolymerase family esterase [Blastococcus sp. LR1]MCA0145237.1 phospholipase [Blastococcus sp. LR1]